MTENIKESNGVRAKLKVFREWFAVIVLLLGIIALLLFLGTFQSRVAKTSEQLIAAEVGTATNEKTLQGLKDRLIKLDKALQSAEAKNNDASELLKRLTLPTAEHDAVLKLLTALRTAPFVTFESRIDILTASTRADYLKLEVSVAKLAEALKTVAYQTFWRHQHDTAHDGGAVGLKQWEDAAEEANGLSIQISKDAADLSRKASDQ